MHTLEAILVIWGLMSLSFALGWMFGAMPPKPKPGPALCPHEDDWDRCPVCCH